MPPFLGASMQIYILGTVYLASLHSEAGAPFWAKENRCRAEEAIPRPCIGRRLMLPDPYGVYQIGAV